MFHVVRAAGDYSMVVVCETEKEVPDPEDLECRFYLYNSNGPKQDFVETNYRGVMTYFSGIADGLGFGMLPEKPFADLLAVRSWHTIERTKNAVACYKTLLDYKDLSEDLRKRCEDGLARASRELQQLLAKAPPT